MESNIYISFTDDLSDEESGAIQLQPPRKGKHRHSVYYDFNGEDHDMDEQSGDEDDPNDELDDIGMNTLSIYCFILCIIHVLYMEIILSNDMDSPSISLYI